MRVEVRRIAQAEAEDSAPPRRRGPGREGGASERGGAACVLAGPGIGPPPSPGLDATGEAPTVCVSGRDQGSVIVPDAMMTANA